MAQFNFLKYFSQINIFQTVYFVGPFVFYETKCTKLVYSKGENLIVDC